MNDKIEKTSSHLEIGGVSLYVEETGSRSPTLVFLHYWGGSHRTWDDVIERLGEPFRSVTYDLRGWGRSGAATDGYSISKLADEAASLIDHLRLEEYVLVGHSMGGKVAQLLASRRPPGLIGLVLVAPASPTPTRLPDEAAQQQLHAYDNRDTALQTIAFLTARMPEPATVEQIVEDSLSGVPEAKLAWPTQAILEDISPEVLKINAPTLVLAGEHDRMDSIEQHRREIIARVSDARLQVVQGSGHLSPIDEPSQLAKAITEFVRRELC